MGPRAARSFFIALVVLATSRTLHAQDAEQCVADHASGQDLRADAALLAARDKFVRCSADACPALVRKECEKLLAEIESAIPSIIVRAKGPDGEDTTDVAVIVDGKTVAERLGVKQLRLDPGQRSLRFRHASGATIERKLALMEGEKGRVVELDFTKSEPKPPEPPPMVESGGGLPAATWVLGGVSAIALGSFVFFGLDGRSKQNDLDECKPNCTDAAYDKMARRYLIADISLAAAVVTGGAALVIALGSDGQREGAIAVRASPLPRGASLGLGTRF